jgi:hypothetical protein
VPRTFRKRHYAAKLLIVSRAIVAPRSPRALAALLAILLAGGCRGGCRKSPSPPETVLAHLPRGATFVAAVDLARIRTTALWGRVSALAEESPEDRKSLQRLSERTGLDPLRQIHRIVAAFPDDARQSGQFALLIDGEGFDERRLVAYAREQGSKIEVRSRKGRTLYGSGNTAGFFLGRSRFVLGGGGWAEALADLADGVPGSAADNGELVHLVERVDRGRALWFAAVVPADLRRSLMADPKLESAGSVTRLAAAADLGPGLTADLVADLSNAADAATLVARIQTTVRESKRNAKMLMLGLGPYLDALVTRADGPTLRVSLALAEGQVKDLIDRLGGLARLARLRSR